MRLRRCSKAPVGLNCGSLPGVRAGRSITLFRTELRVCARCGLSGLRFIDFTERRNCGFFGAKSANFSTSDSGTARS